jgi:hypothetical protein
VLSVVIIDLCNVRVVVVKFGIAVVDVGGFVWVLLMWSSFGDKYIGISEMIVINIMRKSEQQPKQKIPNSGVYVLWCGSLLRDLNEISILVIITA